MTSLRLVFFFAGFHLQTMCLSTTSSALQVSPSSSPQRLRARRWTSRPRSEIQKHPEESDQTLTLEERHDKSSQIVNHVYYRSRVHSEGGLWVDVDQAESSTWRTQGFLSSNHQRVKLSFVFPFYGHLLTDVTVATAGFIYTGEATHNMLNATQYIAPLMADFDSAPSDQASVFYFDNGSALVVQWSHVRLKHDVALGSFSFQTTLLSDGRIVFVYREVPLDLGDLDALHHPVKVGVSDAFVVVNALEQIPDARRRTIYEYHRLDVLRSGVRSRTVVDLFPLPTCLQLSSCAACASARIGFDCSWCSRLQRCSSGFDRHRQDWVDLGCPDQRRDFRCQNRSESAAARPRTTPAVTAASGERGSAHSSSSDLSIIGGRSSTEQTPTSRPGEDDERRTVEQLQVGLLAVIVMVTVAMAAGLLLTFYMYQHPTSSTSIFFMEQRPSWPTLRFSRGRRQPQYCEVEAAGPDKETIVDPSLVLEVRRESEQKDGFIVPDQKQRFLD